MRCIDVLRTPAVQCHLPRTGNVSVCIKTYQNSSRFLQAVNTLRIIAPRIVHCHFDSKQRMLAQQQRVLIYIKDMQGLNTER